MMKRGMKRSPATYPSKDALSTTGPIFDIAPEQNMSYQSVSEVPPPPIPEEVSEPTKQPKNYALADEDYRAWKKASDACRKNPDSLDPLKRLSSRPDLLSWRSPVTGQTLLHELAAGGANETTLQGAVELGCENALVNRKGETAQTIVARKNGVTSGWGFRGPLPRASRSTRGSREVSQLSNIEASSRRSRQSFAPPMQQQNFALPMQQQSLALPMQQQTRAPPPPQAVAGQMQSVSTSCRKKGLSMARGEKAKIAKASINLDLDLNQEETCDRDALEQMVQQAYGGKARVQIDEISESTTNRTSRAGTGRWQNVKCRVMCDDDSEAKTWLSSGAARQTLTNAMNVSNAKALEFATAANVDDVDAVTLKLDSDSSSILCGACLLYTADDKCEKIVCYSDRFSADGSVRHSGDTQVDGKSVHTISIVLSQVPDDITQLYFTLCSCGPADLSGFVNPSIMLYQNNQPDANMLEYSINQAAKSASSVMARTLRQPTWAQGDVAVISRALRKLRLPLLGIDLIIAMAIESSWSLQALGTEEWYIEQKICSNYHYGTSLIEERLKSKASVATEMFNIKRPSQAES